ncbi:hypothetical protein [uncultured Deefgea sp.]|uniref:hypothetical protein n=1 Tax=uncultured Deefgea sp. TaxID=1304914 RepID=UPI00260E1677|nr:hypothetical protein [uncultured Deefgea sp.]
MNSITLSLEINETRNEDGSIDLQVQCVADEEGDIHPKTRQMANMLSKQLQIAVSACQTTMNEGVRS